MEGNSLDPRPMVEAWLEDRRRVVVVDEEERVSVEEIRPFDVTMPILFLSGCGFSKLANPGL